MSGNIVIIRVGIGCECGASKWRVWATRSRVDKIVRVRECKKCGARIETEETAKK